MYQKPVYKCNHPCFLGLALPWTQLWNKFSYINKNNKRCNEAGIKKKKSWQRNLLKITFAYVGLTVVHQSWVASHILYNNKRQAQCVNLRLTDNVSSCTITLNNLKCKSLWIHVHLFSQTNYKMTCTGSIPGWFLSISLWLHKINQSTTRDTTNTQMHRRETYLKSLLLADHQTQQSTVFFFFFCIQFILCW